MSSQAYYDLENNYNDSSGNAKNALPIGAGATFLTQDPKPITGSYVGGVFSDANYISCPVTVFDAMTGTGTIKFSFFLRQGDVGRVPIGSTHSGGRGDMFCIVQNPLSFRIPTSVGSQNFNGGNWKSGRWYTVFMNYSPTGFQVWLKDNAGGIAELVVDQTPLSVGVPDFGGCTNLFLGRAANVGGYPFGGILDNVEFDDAEYHVDPRTINSTLLFLGRGHSYVQGFASSDGNGYRKAAYELWRDTYERSNYFSGDLINGNIITPYNGGVNGDKAADIDSTIDALLDAIYPMPGENHAVLLGPIEYNDMTAATPLATFNASMDSVVNKIDAHSPDIKIFIITGPETPASIAAYAAEIRTVYADALASGKNVFLIDLNTQTIEISGDNIHPTDAGYFDMGIYIATQVELLLTPAPSTTFDIVAIKKALYDWAVRVTGGTAIHEFGDGPKPGKPYIVINLIGPQKPGLTDSVRGVDTGELDFEQFGDRSLTVSVNVYDDNDAITWTAMLQSSLDNPVEIETFSKANIGLGDTGDVNDLTELLETKYERRAQFDFTIFIASVVSFQNNIIKTVEYQNNL